MPDRGKSWSAGYPPQRWTRSGRHLQNVLHEHCSAETRYHDPRADRGDGKKHPGWPSRNPVPAGQCHRKGSALQATRRTRCHAGSQEPRKVQTERATETPGDRRMAVNTKEAEERAHKSAEWADARARDADRAVKWLVIVFLTIFIGNITTAVHNYYQMQQVKRYIEQAEREHDRRLDELSEITRDAFANIEEELGKSFENAFEGTAAQELDQVGAKLNRVEEALTGEQSTEVANAEELRRRILEALQEPEKTESEP